MNMLNFSGAKFDFGTSAEDASGLKVFSTFQYSLFINHMLRLVVERVWMVDWPILNFLVTRLRGKRGDNRNFT